MLTSLVRCGNSSILFCDWPDTAIVRQVRKRLSCYTDTLARTIQLLRLSNEQAVLVCYGHFVFDAFMQQVFSIAIAELQINALYWEWLEGAPSKEVTRQIGELYGHRLFYFTTVYPLEEPLEVAHIDALVGEKKKISWLVLPTSPPKKVVQGVMISDRIPGCFQSPLWIDRTGQSLPFVLSSRWICGDCTIESSTDLVVFEDVLISIPPDRPVAVLLKEWLDMAICTNGLVCQRTRSEWTWLPISCCEKVELVDRFSCLINDVYYVKTAENGLLWYEQVHLTPQVSGPATLKINCGDVSERQLEFELRDAEHNQVLRTVKAMDWSETIYYTTHFLIVNVGNNRWKWFFAPSDTYGATHLVGNNVFLWAGKYVYDGGNVYVWPGPTISWQGHLSHHLWRCVDKLLFHHNNFNDA